MSAEHWLSQFASALGVAPPSMQEIDDILAMAGVAAHAAERIAAPLSAYMVGKAGLPAEEARRLAKELSAALDGGVLKPAATE